MRILRASDRVAVPWKNGGGVTMEVAVDPPGASFDEFGWRISIARIHRGGPFSTFPGIDRELGMLEGQVLLTIAGRNTVDLSFESEPVRFPGDVATSAELVSSAATDLNVMTRRGQFHARMTRVTTIVAEPDAAATFAFPLEPVTVRHGGVDMRLARGDAVLFDSGESAALPAGDYYRVAIFRAENGPVRR